MPHTEEGGNSIGGMASSSSSLEREVDHDGSLRQSQCTSLDEPVISWYPAVVIGEEDESGTSELDSSRTSGRQVGLVSLRLKLEQVVAQAGSDVNSQDTTLSYSLPTVPQLNDEPMDATPPGRGLGRKSTHRPSVTFQEDEAEQMSETSASDAATSRRVSFPDQTGGLLSIDLKPLRVKPCQKQRHLGGTEHSFELESLTIHTFPTAPIVRSVGSVSDCAVTSDGKLAVCAHDDGKASVWDIADTRLVSLYVGHAEALNCIVLSHDDTLAVTGSNDCSVQIWDVSIAEYDCELIGHEDWVYACAVSQDDQMLVTASADKTLRVWDVVTRQTLQLLTGHTSAVLCCQITADGSRVVSGSRDKTARVWDTLTGDALAVFQGHSDWVLCCALLPGDDQQQVATGSADSTLKLWNCDDASEVSTLEGHNDWVTTSITVAVDADDSDDETVSRTRLLSAGEDKTLKIWDVETAELVDSVPLKSVPRAVSAPKVQRGYLPSVLVTKSPDAFVMRSTSVRKLRMSMSAASMRSSRSIDGGNSQPTTPRGKSQPASPRGKSQPGSPRGGFASWRSLPAVKLAGPSLHCSTDSLAETVSGDYFSSTADDMAIDSSITPTVPDESRPGSSRGLKIAISSVKDEPVQRKSRKLKLSSLKKISKLVSRWKEPSKAK